MSLQDFAGALDHTARKSGEPRHFDAITLVRTAGLDAAQKNNLAGRFFYRDMNVFHRGEQVAEFRQFVVMRGEERARTRGVLQMFDDRPGDGEPTKGGRTPPNYLEHHEARGCLVTAADGHGT